VKRDTFQSNGLRLSYLDAGGHGDVLFALHAHWMEATTYIPLAAALFPAWRVIALDQRGHGYSDHAATYTRDDYRRDLLALFTHLGLDQAVLLGNSLGGVNAYQFAARYPNRVLALIIEDIGCKISDDTTFALPWRGIFATPEALANAIGPRISPYLRDSFRQVPGGWQLAFDPADTVASQGFLNGDHWNDWLASDCPALLLRGKDSRVTSQEQLEGMASRRPKTQLQVLAGGHVLHIDNPQGFLAAVQSFLRALPNPNLRSNP
jgi:esterase